MFSTEQLSTPDNRATTDNPGSKRCLTSPFSPEDHLTKKNKTTMSDSELNIDEDEMAASSTPSSPRIPRGLMELPPPDPEILKTVTRRDW